MYFNVPIIAYKSSAIGDTLAGTGILLKEKDYLIAAGWLNRLASDDILRENIIEKQRLRLADFQYETVSR